MTESIIKLVLAVEDEVLKKHFQKDRGGGYSERIIVVVRPDQCIPEVPGMFLERFMGDLESELTKVMDGENGGRPGVAFHERVNLPKTGDELADVLDRFLRRQPKRSVAILN